MAVVGLLGLLGRTGAGGLTAMNNEGAGRRGTSAVCTVVRYLVHNGNMTSMLDIPGHISGGVSVSGLTLVTGTDYYYKVSEFHIFCPAADAAIAAPSRK